MTEYHPKRARWLLDARTLHKGPYIGGFCIGVAIVVILFSPLGKCARIEEVMPAHNSIECVDCHQAAPGTYRQQLHAQILHFFDEDYSADFGSSEVDNDDCNACHRNDADRHPTYRFMEPRFNKQRERLGVQRCVSCHVVHGGKRVVVALTFCEECHSDLQLTSDTTVPTHTELIRSNGWNRCLSCHDYHGNHKMEVPTNLSTAIAVDDLESYFAGGNSPYPNTVYVKAKEKR